MRKGFTLSEVLITLGIIGIIAAVCAPAISNLRPNEYKTKYMKAYNTLSNLTPEILGDEELYWPSYANNRPNCEDMTCRQQPNIAPYNDANSPFWVDNNNTDDLKFPKILASKLNLQGNPVTRNNMYEFRTQDGTYWAFEQPVSGNTNPFNGGQRQPITYLYIAYIDVDTANDRGNNFYNQDNTNPHRFAFGLSHDGGLIPLDRMGQAYLANPTDMHNTQNDIEYADGHPVPENDFNFGERINGINTFINGTSL